MSLRALCLLALLPIVSGCASDGPAREAADDPSAGDLTGGTWEEGDPVAGDWSISWKNLDPKYPATTVSIVNASSEIGRKLLAGASSSEIRVASDAQMGALVSELRKLGFFEHAVAGLALDSVPDVPGKKGVVVLQQDGAARGLLLTTQMGRSAVPQTYANCKKFVITAHMQLQGFDVKASLGPGDERILTAPPPKMPRR